MSTVLLVVLLVLNYDASFSFPEKDFLILLLDSLFSCD